MAAQGVECVSLRNRAETLLDQHGNPLPGELSTLETCEVELIRLHKAELLVPRSRPGSYEPALRHLELWLLNPGVFEDVQRHGPSQYTPPNEYFHADLFSQVVNFARTSPLRWVEAPFNRGSIRIWSRHGEMETEIAKAAEDAVYGDLRELQPFSVQDCWIIILPNKRTQWALSPDGQSLLKNGTDITKGLAKSPRDIRRAESYIETAWQHFLQSPNPYSQLQ